MTGVVPVNGWIIDYILNRNNIIQEKRFRGLALEVVVPIEWMGISIRYYII